MPVLHDFCYANATSAYPCYFPLINSSGVGVTGEAANITESIKVVAGSFDTPDNSVAEEGTKGLYYLNVSTTEIGTADGMIVICCEHASYEDTWIFLRVIDEMPADAKTVSDKEDYSLSDASWLEFFNKTFLGKALWRIICGMGTLFYGRHLGADTSTPQWTDLSGNVIIQLNSVDEAGNRAAISTDNLDDNDWWGTSP